MSVGDRSARRPAGDPAARRAAVGAAGPRPARTAGSTCRRSSSSSAVIVAWELIVAGARTSQSFVLPKPSAIVAALAANWASGRFALLPSAHGDAPRGARRARRSGRSPASPSRSPRRAGSTARASLLPLAIAANAIPIIAFAPLMNNWFGLLNPLSKMMMAAVLVFFPVMANVTRGLVQVEPSALELMRSYAASEWTILRKVRIPNALPYFFTALKVATTLSLIGAIVGEYFGGANSRPRPAHRPERERA